MSEPLVRVRGLHKAFDVGNTILPILKGIDLEVQAGEGLAIVGASGVGKSTLLHMIGTIDRPTSGQVEIGGVDVLALPDAGLAAFRNRRIGLIFQFHHLLPEFTALENVMLPALMAGRSRAEAAALADRVLGEVGLAGRRTHTPTELSGGEQQRVAVARALSLEPEVILADEPTGNLDTQTGEEVFALLRDLQRRRGALLIVVTHNDGLASRMERVVRMVDGRIMNGH